MKRVRRGVGRSWDIAATTLAVLLLLVVWTVPGRAQSARPSGVQRRVLVLHLTQPDSRLSRLIDETYRRELGAALGDRLDYYTEYIDTYRFSEPVWRRGFREFLRDRYGPIGLDLVITPNTAQLRLVRDEDGGIFGDVPIVFHAGAGVQGDARSTGVVSRVDLAAGLQTALDLHPRTRRVIVILGSGAFDTDYANLAKVQLQPFADRVTLEYLIAEPVDEMERSLARLPDDTIIYFLVYSQDAAGRHWLPFDAALRVAAAANVPVYATHEGYLDTGVVGGRLFSTQKTVEASAALALRVLAGENPGDMPVREIDPYIIAFDWRQLSRWRIDEAALPAGSLVMFRPPPAWPRYRGIVLAAAASVVLIVGTWWFEHRRRRRAEVASSAYLDAMTDLDRRATVGHFSASIAHELKQPLTAIRANVDAARRQLDRGSLDPAELREILDDVATSNQRAGDIIDHVRSLVQRHARDDAPVDVDALLTDTLAIVRPTAQTMNARIELELAGVPAIVCGDRVHLQQAVMNLVRNALDAMRELEAAERLVTIRAARANGHVEIAVLDRGPGIPDAVAAQIFEPFVTSKPDGMGMGLFIVRSIVEAHGGHVRVANGPQGGAILTLVLPLRP